MNVSDRNPPQIDLRKKVIFSHNKKSRKRKPSGMAASRNSNDVIVDLPLSVEVLFSGKLPSPGGGMAPSSSGQTLWGSSHH